MSESKVKGGLTAEAAAKIIRGKAPPKRREHPAGNSLYLVHQPSGAASWAYRYRSPLNRKKTVKLVLCPALAERRGKAPTDLGPNDPRTLSEARTLAKAASVEVDKGNDPAAAKAAARAPKPVKAPSLALPTDTVKALGEAFIKEYITPNRKSPKEVERQFKAEINPVWADREVTTITKDDVIALTDAIRDRPSKRPRKGVTANRVKGTLSAFFAWLLEHGKVTANPCEGVKPRVNEKPRDRLLHDWELPLFWQACDALEYPFGDLHKLLVLTGQRRSEVAGIRKSEIITRHNEDTGKDEPFWLIPASRTKNGKENLVPLVPAVVAILEGLEKHCRKGFYFTTNGGRTPASGFSRAKTRLDALMQKADPDVVIAPFTAHDLRATMYSGLSRLKVSREVAERLVNHRSTQSGKMASVYDRYSYDEEKREALEKWTALVLKLVAGKREAQHA